MCGRAAQTQGAVRAAEAILMKRASSSTSSSSGDGGNANSTSTKPAQEEQQQQKHEEFTASTQFQDNYNMAPGMSSVVFWMDKNASTSNTATNRLCVDRKVWGLVPKHGTPQHPLHPNDMSQHFSNLMFNARSDTLLDKRTFRSLFMKRQTCLIAVDGFFEWKAAALKGSRKQPYFVYRKPPQTSHDDSITQTTQRPFLLLAGLWTSVSTGRSEEPTLDTYTILTTDACPCLTWLHSRMPVCIWDDELAYQWLTHPSPTLLQQLDESARTTPETHLQWHAVSTQMSSMKYRTADAIAQVKESTTPSVKNFFMAKSPSMSRSTASSSMSPTKRSAIKIPTTTTTRGTTTSSPADASPAPRKKAKLVAAPTKKSIASFFSPKPKNPPRSPTNKSD